MADSGPPDWRSGKKANDSIRTGRRRPRVYRPQLELERRLRVGPSLSGGGAAGQSNVLAWLLAGFTSLAVVMGVLWFSSETALQLKPEPPPAFFAVKVYLPGDQQAWARQYWQQARDIQSMYTFGKPLPDVPPPAFHIPEESTVAAPAAREMRLAYWEQLQEVWLDPEAWETSRRWISLASVRNWLGL